MPITMKDHTLAAVLKPAGIFTFFFLNSKTLTAPRETLATGGLRPSCGCESLCQPHMSYLSTYSYYPSTNRC